MTKKEAIDFLYEIGVKVEQIQAIMEAFTRGQAPGWISVSEMLPEIEEGRLTSEIVLKNLANGTREMGVYCKDGNWIYYDIDGVKTNYNGEVIAWMPLPEPYKEGEVEE